MRHAALLIIGAGAALLAACDAADRSPQRGTFSLPAGAKAEGPYSCAGHCGADEATLGGCFCDGLCARFGDCCPDKQAVCDQQPNCPNICDAICAGQPEPPLPPGCPTPMCQCDPGCPQIAAPGPDFCPDGMIEPKTDAQGCTIGFDCIPCPALNPPGPGFCPEGTITPKLDPSGVCTIGFDCEPACPNICEAICAGEPEPPLPPGCPTPGCQCTAECPQIAPPAPDFCPDGKIEQRKDAQGICTIGFDCRPCDQLNPPYCPNGTLKANYDDRGVCIVSIDCIPNP